jgi:hypothetical protein
MNTRQSKSYGCEGSKLRFMNKGLRMAAACIGLAASAYGPTARAATPLVSLVGPDEWHLPIVPSMNLFLQSGLAQTNSAIYDPNGNSHGIPGSHLYAGVTRFAHLFSFEELPGVGFGIEYLQPYLDAELPGQSITGLADPLFEIGGYFKPAPGLTLGYINVPSVPVGSNELSKHFWSDANLILWNYHIDKFGFNGTFLAGFSSTQHQGGKDTDPGSYYAIEGTALYEVTPWLAPFIAYTYNRNNAGRDLATNAPAPGQGPLYSCLFPGACHEQLLGGGLNFHIGHKNTLAVWYYGGIGGENVVKTNAAYLFYTHAF